VLDDKEKTYLQSAVGRWPDYPEAIEKLAKKHGLTVPWQILPEFPPEWSRDRWEHYRLKPQLRAEALPELPRPLLRDFALVELTPQERGALRLSHTDPLSWHRLTEAYYKRYPEVLRKTLQRDRELQLKQHGPFLHLPPQRPGIPANLDVGPRAWGECSEALARGSRLNGPSHARAGTVASGMGRPVCQPPSRRTTSR